jgi:hypothetical protein
MRPRDVAVALGVLAGLVVGWLLAGGQTPDLDALQRDLDAAGNGGPLAPLAPVLAAIVGGVVGGWVVNRWIEHAPRNSDQD